MLRLAVCFLLTLFLVAAIAGKTELHIVSLALSPYSYELDGKLTGLVFDLGNALAEEAGLTAQNRQVRVLRAVEEIALGRADMVLMLPTSAIEKVADNLGPILPMETIALGRRGADFRSVEELRGKTVASVRGTRYDERISPENGITIYQTTNYLHSLKLLLGNRVDAVAGPRFGLMYTIRENGLPPERFGAPLLLNTNEVCVFLSRKVDQEVAWRLQEAMVRMELEGKTERIRFSYDPQYR
jgi:ABC-type amino acid transport substrate-binding protein